MWDSSVQIKTLHYFSISFPNTLLTIKLVFNRIRTVDSNKMYCFINILYMLLYKGIARKLHFFSTTFHLKIIQYVGKLQLSHCHPDTLCKHVLPAVLYIVIESVCSPYIFVVHSQRLLFQLIFIVENVEYKLRGRLRLVSWLCCWMQEIIYICWLPS